MEEMMDAKKNSIYEFDRNQAAHLEDIQINEDDEQKKRILDYVKQVKNPYFNMVGDVLVQMEYADTPYSFNARYKRIIVNANS